MAKSAEELEQSTVEKMKKDIGDAGGQLCTAQGRRLPPAVARQSYGCKQRPLDCVQWAAQRYRQADRPAPRRRECHSFHPFRVHAGAPRRLASDACVRAGELLPISDEHCKQRSQRAVLCQLARDGAVEDRERRLQARRRRRRRAGCVLSSERAGRRVPDKESGAVRKVGGEEEGGRRAPSEQLVGGGGGESYLTPEPQPAC